MKPNVRLLSPPSGPEPPVYWSVCFGGQFFSASVFRRHVLCVDWLVPGARPGEIASLSTIPTNPVPPLTCWGPAEHKTPPPWDDACIWRLIGGRVFALYPSPGSHLFSARARWDVLREERIYSWTCDSLWVWVMNMLCKLWLDVPETTKTQPSIYIHYLNKGGTEGSVRLKQLRFWTLFFFFFFSFFFFSFFFFPWYSRD